MPDSTHREYIEYRQKQIVGTYQIQTSDLHSFVFRDDSQDNTVLLPAIDSIPDGIEIEVQSQIINASSVNNIGIYPGSSDKIDNENAPYLFPMEHQGQRLVLRADKTNKIWWFLINYYPGNVL